MFLRKNNKGDWYIARVPPGAASNRGRHASKCYRDWFFVKEGSSNSKGGYLSLSRTLSLPTEFIGKKIKFKVEVINDKEISEK